MSRQKPPVQVFTPDGKRKEIAPIKCWEFGPRYGKKNKIGIFRDPETGKYFRAKLPDDYPC